MKSATRGALTALLAFAPILVGAGQQHGSTSPSETAAGNAYRIQPNDSVRSVAVHFRMTPQDLLHQLRKPFRPGQLIFVNPPSKPAEQTADSDSWMGLYEVQSGETLERIAAKLQVSIEEIGELNALEITADVRSGDTLAKIAQRHNTTVDKLANWNECFPTDILYPGMSLTVGWEKIVTGERVYYPVRSRAIENIDLKKISRDRIAYTVRHRDTIERIAVRQNCSAREIRDLNALGESEQPKVGELLFLSKPMPNSTQTGPATHGQLWDGKVVQNSMMLRAPGADPIARMKAGRHVSVVGAWGEGYAILLSGKGYGWASRKSIQLGKYVVDAQPNRNISQAIRVAYTYLNTPYVFGGNTYHGIDCSALIKNAMVAANVWTPEAPRVACDQMHIGIPVTADQLRPGDRVYFYFGRTPPGYADHTGLYIGGGQVIHASSSHHGVTVACLFSGGLWRAFIGARRDTVPNRSTCLPIPAHTEPEKYPQFCSGAPSAH